MLFGVVAALAFVHYAPQIGGPLWEDVIERLQRPLAAGEQAAQPPDGQTPTGAFRPEAAGAADDAPGARGRDGLARAAPGADAPMSSSAQQPDAGAEVGARVDASGGPGLDVAVDVQTGAPPVDDPALGLAPLQGARETLVGATAGAVVTATAGSEADEPALDETQVTATANASASVGDPMATTAGVRIGGPVDAEFAAASTLDLP